MGIQSDGVMYVIIILISLVKINIFLMLFNLLPITPLDGSGVLQFFLSPRTLFSYQQWSRKLMFVFLIVLLMTDWIYLFYLQTGRQPLPVRPAASGRHPADPLMNHSDDYIRVKLELFEGPLDLLLHLIRSQQIDISAVSITQITDQYLSTIELMKELDLDVAGEFLVMAATLILIKSRMLLPPSDSENDDLQDEDPRDELIRRLKEYELFKAASLRLEELESEQSLLHSRPQSLAEQITEKEFVIDASLFDLLNALKDIVQRRKEVIAHIVKPNPVSVRHKMSRILELIMERGVLLFSEVFDDSSTRQDVIATFLAVLELVRTQMIRARQKGMMTDIRLVLAKARHGH